MTTGPSLVSITGHHIKTVGKTSVNVLGKDIEFFVVKNLNFDFLLGSDALRILNSSISYVNNEVTLSDTKHKLSSFDSFDPCTFAVYSELDWWMREFPDVFAGEGQPTGKTDITMLEIDTGDHPPIRQRAYRIPLTKRLVVEHELEKMLAEEVVEPSSSPWASPITLVTKKDGGTRFCVDFRKINSITRKDAHPLPNIQDIFDSMAGSSVFSTLDLKSGYWQIGVHPNSIEKTAFITHKGLFQFKRMPFGLCNASAVFQRTMNKILAPYVGDFVLVYIDDVVIYSKSQEEHDEHLRKVFQALQNAGLKVKPSKCRLRAPEINLLGFIIDKHGKRSDPEKTKAICNMDYPKSVSEIRSFLGMVGYHRQHIPNYAEIAFPLTQLTKKNAQYQWGAPEGEAWERLKTELVSDRVMAHPQLDKPYKLYTDASAYAIGAILVQEDENGLERPVLYVSKQLNEAQMKYATIEREAYAIVYALQKLRPYLYGAEFTIYTDQKPLLSLFLQEQRNSRTQRWAVLIAEYGAPIEYRKGRNNVRADMLSRIHPKYEVLEKEGVISFIDDSFDDDEIPWEFDHLEKECVRREQMDMPEFELGRLEQDGNFVHDGLLYTLQAPPGKAEYPRLVLPPSARFRVIRRAHAELGHQGIRKTLDRVQEAYKWPCQRKDVGDVIAQCARCIVHKNKRESPEPGSMPIAHYPGQIIGIDMTGPYPLSRHGNLYALSIIDHCTGWVEVKPLPNKTAETVLRYLEQEYLPRYGPPEILISDNGSEFKNHLVKGYLEELGVEIRHCTPYHPQSNGKVERFHRTLKQMLSKLVNARANDWEDCLGPALWAHRISTSSVTGFTPYFLTFGRKPPMPQLKLLQRVEGMERDVLASRIDELSRAFKEAARNTAVSRVYNTERLRQRAQAGDLQVGDHVVVYASDAGRLEPHWDHGFVVTHVRGPVVKVVGPRNKRLTLNRDKVKLVAPESDWDNLRNRLTHTERAALQRASVPASKDVNAPSASPRNANQSVGPELRPELNVDNEGHFNNGHAGSDMSDISDSVPEPRGMRRLATDLDPT